jgi:hypothetical protein
MRNFLINILYYSVILFFLNIILNYYGNKVYLGTYKECSLNYKSYLLSDSHGLPLKRYTEKYNVFNFSAGSDSYFDMKRKLNYLISNTKLDTVFITVDDHTLSPYRELKNNLDRSVYFATLADYDNIFELLKEKLVYNISFLQPKKRTILKKYIKYKIKRIVYGNHILHDKIDEKSWADLTEEQRLASSKGRFYLQFPGTEKSEKLKKTLEEIIRICNKNNIVLIGVKFPLTKEYIETIGKKTYGASGLFIEKGLKVMDYKTIFINKEECFLNQDHLNAKGGEEFSNVLFNKNIVENKLSSL